MDNPADILASVLVAAEHETPAKIFRRKRVRYDENNGGTTSASTPVPDERFSRRVVSQVQIDFAFSVHFKNALAAAARARVLSELHNRSLRMEQAGREVFPNEAWQQLWRNYYTQFLTDWYDWYMCVGIVPYRIVEIQSGVFVPRVPKGRFCIKTYVNPNTDVQCFEYWRWLEATEAESTAPRPGQRLPGYADWYYDRDVRFHAHIGADPCAVTGELRSSVSSIVGEAVFAQALQTLHLKQLALNTVRRPWLENKAPYRPSKQNLEGIPYAYYGRSDDPDQDDNSDDETLGDMSRLTSERKQANAQLDLVALYEESWSKYVDSAPPSGTSLSAASEAVVSQLAEGADAVPAPLPPQMAIKEKAPVPTNGAYVPQVELSQDQIAAIYGLSRDMIIGRGGAQRGAGNKEATDKSLGEKIDVLAWYAGDALTSVFSEIHRRWEVETAMRSFGDEEGDEALELAERGGGDVFAKLQRHYKRARVTLQLVGPCRVSDSDELQNLWMTGVIEWENYVMLQQNRTNITPALNGAIPKPLFNDEERKAVLLGRKKEAPAKTSAKR